MGRFAVILVSLTFTLNLIACSNESDIGPINPDIPQMSATITEVDNTDKTSDGILGNEIFAYSPVIPDGYVERQYTIVDTNTSVAYESIVYESGVWHVNKTIAPGLYRIVLDTPSGEGLAVVERSGGYDFEEDDIIATGVFWGMGMYGY